MVERYKVYAETLQHAAEVAGGAAALAKTLGVRRAQLRRWLSGDEAPPLEAFLTALDLIAYGPLLRPARRKGHPVSRTPARHS